MRLRTVLVTVPIALLLWFGIGAYLIEKHNADLAAAQQVSRNLTRAFEENIRRTVEAIDTTIRAARVARAHDPAHFDLAAWARDSGLTRELTLQLSLADRTGEITASNLASQAGLHATIADRPHFRIPRDTPEDTIYISDPVLGRVSNRWSVQFVRKLYDSAGHFDGVIVASLDPAFLGRFYTSLDIGRGALLLLGTDGVVRSAAPQGVAHLGANLANTPLMRAISDRAHGTMEMTGPEDGILRIVSWRQVDPYGLEVMVGLSVTEALTDYARDMRVCVTAGIGMTILIIIVSAVLARHRRDARRSQEMLRAAVDNISQGLMVVDASRHVPVMNARVAELLELPPHLTRPGIDFDSLLEWQLDAGEFADRSSQSVRTLVESGGIEAGNSVYQRARANGTVLEVRTKVLKTGLAIRTFTDITEQQNAARVLAEARDAAEAAAKARSAFLAVMSHEIRTPLNGVIGVAGLLEDMELGPEQRGYVHLIRQSGDHLLDLINHILDFSRLEADRMELDSVTFEPRSFLQDIVAMFASQATAQGLSLSADTDAQVPVSVLGDEGRLRQVLLNLIGNAVKFTHRGSVSVTLASAPPADGRVRLFFAVTDTGIGIAPDSIGRMFHEFTQMDGSISRRFGGSGLGLAICQRLVELMGGKIAVESQPGQGSTFRFDVTMNQVATSVRLPIPAAPVAQPSLRVLLAEDNPTNRLVALRLLGRLGHETESAANGMEALIAWQTGHYDLIVMDVMMPEMDGLTATRRIRAAEGSLRHTPIVGLTAGAGAESLAACIEAGMDAVTTKPVTLDRLRAAIAEGLTAVAQIPGQVPGQTPGQPPVSRPADPVSPQPVRPAPSSTTQRLRELALMLGDEAVTEIIATFAEDTRDNLAAMRVAAGDGDGRALFRAAHSVAGAARNVGADALAARASTLEETAGAMSTIAILAKIERMQADLDEALRTIGIQPRITAST